MRVLRSARKLRPGLAADAIAHAELDADLAGPFSLSRISRLARFW
jgi:hypothetical protein